MLSITAPTPLAAVFQLIERAPCSALDLIRVSCPNTQLRIDLLSFCANLSYNVYELHVRGHSPRRAMYSLVNSTRNGLRRRMPEHDHATLEKARLEAVHPRFHPIPSIPVTALGAVYTTGMSYLCPNRGYLHKFRHRYFAHPPSQECQRQPSITGVPRWFLGQIRPPPAA